MVMSVTQRSAWPKAAGDPIPKTFEVTDRVIVRLPGLTIRGVVIDAQDGIEPIPGIPGSGRLPMYAVRSNYGTAYTGILEDIVSFEGVQTLLATGADRAAFEASGASSPVQFLQTGDSGQIVMRAAGLGLLAVASAFRLTAWQELVPAGAVPVSHEVPNANTWIIHWEVTDGTVIASHQVAAMSPQVFVITWPVVAFVLAIAGLTVAVGLAFFPATDLLLNGSPGSPPIPLPPGSTVPPEVPREDGSMRDVECAIAQDGTCLPPGSIVPPGGAVIPGEAAKRGLIDWLDKLRPLIIFGGIALAGLAAASVLNSVANLTTNFRPRT